MTATNRYSKAGQPIRSGRKAGGTKDEPENEPEIPILINDGTRTNSEGRVEVESIRVDTIIPTPAELGEEGTPRRDQKSSQAIAEELRKKFRFEKPCYQHGAPGCDICLKTVQSLLRDLELKVIKKWLMESAPLEFIHCDSNILALYNYLTDRETDVTSNNLLAASRLVDLKSDPKNKSGRIILPEAPSPITTPFPTYVFRRTSPPPKPKRGRPAKPEETKVFDSLRKAVGLTARQVVELMERRDFNCKVVRKDYDAMMLDDELRRCYVGIVQKERGWYRGLSYRTMNEFVEFLPDIIGPLFSDDELQLYRDYAFNNDTTDNLLLRGDVFGLEERIIRRLQKMKLVNANTCRIIPGAEQTSDAVYDLHDDHKESEAYGEGLSVIGDPSRRLSSFEHGGKIQRVGGPGSDHWDTRVDWGSGEDDPIEE
jgi:hypothetical protein